MDSQFYKIQRSISSTLNIANKSSKQRMEPVLADGSRIKQRWQPLASFLGVLLPRHRRRRIFCPLSLVFDGAHREIMTGTPFLPAVARLASAALYGGSYNGCLRTTSRMILVPPSLPLCSIVSPDTWEPATGGWFARVRASFATGGGPCRNSLVMETRVHTVHVTRPRLVR